MVAAVAVEAAAIAKGEDDFVVLTNEDKSNNYPSEDDFGDFSMTKLMMILIERINERKNK